MGLIFEIAIYTPNSNIGTNFCSNASEWSMEPVFQFFSNLLISATSSLMQTSAPGVAYSLRMDRLFGKDFDKIGPAELRPTAAPGGGNELNLVFPYLMKQSSDSAYQTAPHSIARSEAASRRAFVESRRTPSGAGA